MRDAFPEIERPGVYILIGSDENEPDRKLAYIGESEGVGARLSYHNSNELGRDTKGFWTDTVVLISKDENLTKSHARYVEACLIRSVGRTPRWSLPGALGWDLFREMRGRPAEAVPIIRDLPEAASVGSLRFFFRGEGFAAEMEVGPSGDFVVRSGSKARVRTTTTIPRGTTALRNTLLDIAVDVRDLAFSNGMKDVAPSCFHSASTGAGNANAAPGRRSRI